jgi:hypothetical protein
MTTRSCGWRTKRAGRPVGVEAVTGGYPAFDCKGFSSGTSGGPWLALSPPSARPVMTAVIGGLNHGGCDDATSYSSAFGAPVLDLFSQAVASRTPSVLPAQHGDGC